MCSEWQTLGVSAIAAITSLVKSFGCGLVNRTRSSPSFPQRSAGPQQLAERVPVAELHPVRVDVLAEQGDLEDALGDQGLDLGQDVARAAVLLLAAQRRHDAEGAGVVAAHGDGDPAGVGRLAPGRQRGREDLERLEDLHLGAAVVPGPLQQHRQRADVVGAEDHVDPRRLPHDLAAVLLGQAAADRDLHAGVGVLDRAQVPEVAVEAVVRVLPYRAGVEDDHVGVAAVGAHVAGRLEQTADPLRVVHVHLAAEGPHVVRARRLVRGCHSADQPSPTAFHDRRDHEPIVMIAAIMDVQPHDRGDRRRPLARLSGRARRPATRGPR